MKAVEMQALLLKTSFVVIFQCTNTLWCHINILFVVILTILMYLFQFLLSYNSKQLSTFHLPFGGDENVLAKDVAPWPKVWNPRFLSSFRLVFVFFRNFLKINILEIHYLTLLLQPTSTTPPCLHQRPPSVGMPRHALRRRMPNAQCHAVIIARCRDFYSFEYVARVGRAPGALLCLGVSYF